MLTGALESYLEAKLDSRESGTDRIPQGKAGV